MPIKQPTPDQKAVSLIETHQIDGATRIATANIDRHVSGTESWYYWHKVLTQIDIRRYEKRTASMLRASTCAIALAFAYGFEFLADSAASLLVI